MKITVLLNTYNNELYVEEAIKSILNQTFTNFDFLIIDDYSTDKTIEIVKMFKDQRIKLITNDYNLGLGERINQGLRLSSNDIIARMDGDDISLPNRLLKQLLFLKQNDNIDILSCRYAVIINNKIRYVVNSCSEHTDIRKKLVLHSDIIHPGVIYNRNTILKFGGYKNIPIEDYELWLRIKDSVVFGNVPEVLLLKRYHNAAISQQIKTKNPAVYNYLTKYYKDLPKEFGINDVNLYKGWREYFYGEQNKVRSYFRKINLLSLNYRVFLAYIVTFLNEKHFIVIKELRIRYMLKYWFGYFNKENIRLRKTEKLIFLSQKPIMKKSKTIKINLS